MRIGILGNCQASGFAAGVAALAPGHDILLVSAHLLHAPSGLDPARLEDCAERLAGCDLVFAQALRPAFGPLSTRAFAARRPDRIKLPRIAFTGFHPDCVHLQDGAGKPVRGPTGPYHSALAAACFLEGLPPARTLRLFNAFLYGALGYFDAWRRDVAQLGAEWAAHGFDLDAALREAPGVFMHTVNHPRIGILVALARQALAKAGLAPRNGVEPPEDPLDLDGTWPVYPEIARRLGTEGGLLFRPAGGVTPLDLPSWLERAWAAYAALPGLAPEPAVERARAVIRREVLGQRPPPLDAPARPEDIRMAHLLILGRDGGDETAREWAASGLTLGEVRRRLLAARPPRDEASPGR